MEGYGVLTSRQIKKESIKKEGGASLHEDYHGKPANENVEDKLAKQQRKKEERLREKALRVIMEKELGPSPTASNLHLSAEQARKKQKKIERRNQKKAEKGLKDQEIKKPSGATGNPDNGGDAVMADVDSMPAGLDKLTPPPDDDEVEDMEDGGAPVEEKRPGYTAPPSGMNRAVRRRLQLIEQEKVKIQKKLGVPTGSNEKEEEVKYLLEQWTKVFDDTVKKRKNKKKDRKTKEATRVHEKKGKRLLKETEKVSGKKDRQEVRQAKVSCDT